jgi:HK97 family phage portal protein
MQRFGKSLRKLPSRRSRTSQAIVNAGMLVSSPVLSAILVTPQTAMNFTSVFSAVNCITTDLASLPFSTMKRVAENAMVPAPRVIASKVMGASPNPENNWFRFRQSLLAHALLWGNGYGEVVRDPWDGSPQQIWLLNPAYVQPKRRDGSNELFYLLNDNGKELKPEDVIHVAGLGFDGIVGYSAIHQCRQAVGLGIAAEEYGAAYFGNGMTPKGILKSARKVSGPARQNLRESVYNVHQTTKNAHHLMILEEGMEWVNTVMPLNDAQFLATRAFQNLEIARIYRVPPHKLGDYSQSHLANIEEANRNYVETTLAGWALSIEAEFDSKLLFEKERNSGVFWHHNFFKLERGNTQARTTYYQVMRNLGVMSADDIRVSEGMNPIGPDKGGDLYLMQAQYTPLADAGRAADPATPPAPKDGKEDDEPSDTDTSAYPKDTKDSKKESKFHPSTTLYGRQIPTHFPGRGRVAAA